MKRPICALADLFPGDGFGPAAAHRAGCLRCQAEGARRRSLARSLAALGSVVEPAPPGLYAAVMDDLGPQPGPGLAPNPRSRRRLVPYAAGAGVGLALLAGVALGLLRRRARLAA